MTALRLALRQRPARRLRRRPNQQREEDIRSQPHIKEGGVRGKGLVKFRPCGLRALVRVLRCPDLCSRMCGAAGFR